MSKLTVLPSASPLQKQIEMPFGEWILHFGKRLAAVLGSGILLTVSSSIFKGLRALNDETGWRFFPLFISAVQFCVIFFAVLFSSKLPQFLDDQTPGDLSLSDGANQIEHGVMRTSGYNNLTEWHNAKALSMITLEQFKDKWLAIWICWLCLYFVLSVIYIPGYKHQSLESALQLIATLFNNLATLMILFCYFILSQPTIVRTPTGSYRKTIEWHRWVAVLIVFTVIEALFIALALGAIPNPLGLTPKYVTTSLNWVSGIASATVMGLLIGRLDSKFLECPTWFLVMLYLYAAIQPLFALLGDEHKWWTIILMNAALIFKCLLYLYINWLFQTGRLLFYLMRVRRLYDQVGDDFKEFSLLLRKAS